MGWFFRLDTFLEQEELMKTYLSDLEKQICDFNRVKDDIVVNSAFV